MANKDWIGTGADKLTFGERLGDLINNRGITQSQLAENTGVNQSALSDYINKNKAPTCATIIALAQYFSVSTDYLLGRTIDPYPNGTTMEDLGISAAAAEKFRECKSCNLLGREYLDSANQMLETEQFWDLMFSIHEYTYASKADAVIKSLLPNLSNYDEHIDSIKDRMIEIAGDFYSLGEYAMYDFLMAKADSLSQDSVLERLCLVDYTLAELCALRINRQLEAALYVFRQVAEADGVNLVELYMEGKERQ